MNRGMRKSSTSWNNSSRNGVRKDPWPTDSMQFGASADDADRTLKFTLFNRLCITAPDTSSSMIQQWDEKILLLNRYKGNY